MKKSVHGRGIVGALSIMMLCCSLTVAQTRTVIGIVPFKRSADRYRYTARSQDATVIQDAVTNAFLRSKRFALVEREKMDQIKSEKMLQRNEDFIDGRVIEQSKALGAEYLVTGNVTKAEVETSKMRAPIAGTITTYNADVAFSLKVTDVATGEIVASRSFAGSGHGKNAMQMAMQRVEPDIEQFIRDNFRLIVSIASVEEKNANGHATKVLLACGTAVGMKAGDALKVYEARELTVDGKSLTRKMPLGKVVVSKVEDENFSVCNVVEGGADIAAKLGAGAKIKCELLDAENGRR